MEQSQDSVKLLTQRVLGFLAIRMRSKHELRRYLEEKVDDSQIIDQVFLYLETHNLIDDKEFARLWAESRLRKLKGDLFIKLELRQKGISDSIISETIRNIDIDNWNIAIKNCLSKYKRKWNTLKGYPQKAKKYTLLNQRGFSSTHIDAFLRDRVE